MRKMMNKKGFTLVELMIVVVILGILVAIAIPIFTSVTKNAKIKACKSNIRIIEGNLSTYLATGNDGAPVTSGTWNDIKGNSAFTAMFKGGAVPTCPNATTDNEYDCDITWTDGVASYEVTCGASGVCPNAA